MAGKSETPAALAYRVYIEMGAKRSIAGLEAKLKKMGHKPSRSTLMRWQKKFKWDEDMKEGDKLAAAAKEATMHAHAIVEAVKEAPVPFTVDDTFEGTANAIHAMTACMSKVVEASMTQHLKCAVALEFDQLLAMARVTVDLGKTAADMHRARQAQAPAAKRDENGVLQVPGVMRSPLADLLETYDPTPPMTR